MRSVVIEVIEKFRISGRKSNNNITLCNCLIAYKPILMQLLMLPDMCYKLL